MVLPEEREDQFKKKMTSPLFKEHFENENWRLIYFDTLRNAYVKDKNRVDIYELIDKKVRQSKEENISDKQGRLF